MIDSTPAVPAVSRSDRTRYWYDRLGGIFSDLGDLHIFHGHDDQFGDEIAELGSTVSELYYEIEEGKLAEAEAEKQATDLTRRLDALTARIYTDGRLFTATDAEAALVLDVTLAAYDDATPLTLDDLGHVLAITGYNTRWLMRALTERTEEGLLAVDAVAGTWQVLDPEGLRTRDQSDTPTEHEQQPANMSDEQALNLALALWADGKPFSPADLDGVLAFTGNTWTWLLVRLGERVVGGLLGYDTATGYRVIDPDALKALVLGTQPTISAPVELGPAPRDQAVRDGDPIEHSAPAPVHPMVAAASARPCPACGGPTQIRQAARARTAFGLAMLALVVAALTAAPAALTIALIVVLAATGIRFIRLAPAPCRHRL
ncbi:hypothetical protein [Streptosporangium sp. NPDC000509]|uniref:hypothetical protein n=1 Tax=Streptosporangium sp. NPDC000509 TaxID=3366186 RepID=UPI0036906CDE